MRDAVRRGRHAYHDLLHERPEVRLVRGRGLRELHPQGFFHPRGAPLQLQAREQLGPRGREVQADRAHDLVFDLSAGGGAVQDLAVQVAPHALLANDLGRTLWRVLAGSPRALHTLREHEVLQAAGAGRCLTRPAGPARPVGTTAGTRVLGGQVDQEARPAAPASLAPAGALLIGVARASRAPAGARLLGVARASLAPAGALLRGVGPASLAPAGALLLGVARASLAPAGALLLGVGPASLAPAGALLLGVALIAPKRAGKQRVVLRRSDHGVSGGGRQLVQRRFAVLGGRGRPLQAAVGRRRVAPSVELAQLGGRPRVQVLLIRRHDEQPLRAPPPALELIAVAALPPPQAKHARAHARHCAAPRRAAAVPPAPAASARAR